MIEAIVIIVALGGLELSLWLIDRKELRTQTELLEDIAVSLSLRENVEPHRVSNELANDINDPAFRLHEPKKTT